MKLKLYCLVRSDLSRSQQAVQAGHAVAEWCKNEHERYWWDGTEHRHEEWRWHNGTLVYLRVVGEDELRHWFERCEEPVAFYEPDIGNQMTAFCTLTPAEGFDLLKLL